MKKFRKLLALVLVVCMVCAVSTTAFAADDGPTPYAPICGNCDKGVLLTTVRYSSWSRNGSAGDCIHGYAFGEDLELVRTKTTTKKCNVCGSTDIIPEEETKLECHGHN